MFPKNSLDLVILSIINEFPDGITGYTLLKELEKRFGEERKLSAGTIYPRLNKLKGIFAEETDGTWKITPKGKAQLENQLPDVLTESLEFMPVLYKFLMKAMPFGRRMDFLSHASRMGECTGCGPQHDLLDTESIKEDLNEIPNEGSSIKRLEEMKKKLAIVKKETEDRVKAQLASLDNILKSIDEKIEKCMAEKASWKRIPIEEGKFDDR
nr:PadR family transcriptional regulator [Candidatus Sigynarchaeota archaeon]